MEISIDNLDPNMTVKDMIQMFAGYRVYIPKIKVEREMIRLDYRQLKGMQVEHYEICKQLASKYQMSIKQIKVICVWCR